MLTEIRQPDPHRSRWLNVWTVILALGCMVTSARAQIGDNAFRDAGRGVSLKIPPRWVQLDPAAQARVSEAVTSFNVYAGYCRTSGFVTFPLVILSESDFEPRASSLRVLQKQIDARPIEDVPGLRPGATIAEVLAKLPANDVIVFDETVRRYYVRKMVNVEKSEANRSGKVDVVTIGFVARDRLHELGLCAVDGLVDMAAADFELFASSFRLDSDREWQPSASETEKKRGSKGGDGLALDEGQRRTILVVLGGAGLALGVCVLNAVIRALAR